MTHPPKKSNKPDLPYGEDLPSVEDLPVLPPMLNHMDLDLAVAPDGRFYIFYEKPFPEDIDYVMYNAEQARLQLVGVSGRLQDVGLTVHEKLQDHMEMTSSVYLIQVEGTKAIAIAEVMLMKEDEGTYF